MKIRIKTPATSANLGPGFDFLGIALRLYNVYEFEENSEFATVGFDNVGENLALLTYKRVLIDNGIQLIPVKITLVECNIPPSRGLGSSASAVLAGVLAGVYFGKINITRNSLELMLSKYEGHPDNIFASFYGGLVSSVYDGGKYHTLHHFVDESLKFNLFIPKYKVSTKDAREALPLTLSYDDVRENASRALMIDYAFKIGDLEQLKIALKDSIHEKYRKKFIKEYEIIKEELNALPLTFNISGAGPTMISISKDYEVCSIVESLNLDIDILSVEMDSEGVKVEVIE